MTAALRTSVAGIEFANPVLLASGTAGYGRELAGVIDLDRIGGFVTKAVSPEPRHGNDAPRVWDFDGGMINAVGLANRDSSRCAARRCPGSRSTCDRRACW